MKKIKLLKLFKSLSVLNLSILFFATSCSTSSDNSQITSLNESINNANVKAIANLFNLDLKSELSKQKIKDWSDFSKKINSINYNNENSKKEFSDLVSNNWMLYFANHGLYKINQFGNSNQKWFLYNQTENVKHSDLFLHSIGLLKISNEKLASKHSHVTFPNRTIYGFSFYTGISKTSTISNQTNLPFIFIVFDKLIYKIYLENNQIKLDERILYLHPQSLSGIFINRERSFDDTYIDEFKKYFDLKDNQITKDLLNNYENDFLNKNGIPANVYITVLN